MVRLTDRVDMTIVVDWKLNNIQTNIYHDTSGWPLVREKSGKFDFSSKRSGNFVDWSGNF